jgi:hypothetical protein
LGGETVKGVSSALGQNFLKLRNEAKNLFVFNRRIVKNVSQQVEQGASMSSQPTRSTSLLLIDRRFQQPTGAKVSAGYELL